MRTYRGTLGYYGKLPLSAEFIRCQASGIEIDELDRWLREGMYHAKASLGRSWSQEFIQGDSWGFCYMPRQGNRFLVGLLKPTQDKAGREFPFLVYLLLEKGEFLEGPWCAPMQFKQFFEHSHRLLASVGSENDLARLQLRLQALAPLEESEPTSIEARYHAELLGRRVRDHWMTLFGESGDVLKGQLLRSLFRLRSAVAVTDGLAWQVKLPLLPLSQEETYDLPFWIDVAYRASARQLDTQLLFWNRWPTNGAPVLLLSHGRPSPELLLHLIRSDHWPQRQFASGDTADMPSDGERRLIEDADATMEAFLQQLSGVSA